MLIINWILFETGLREGRASYLFAAFKTQQHASLLTPVHATTSPSLSKIYTGSLSHNILTSETSYSPIKPYSTGPLPTSPTSFTPSRSLRSTNAIFLNVPKTKHKTWGGGAFSVAVHTVDVWNTLPFVIDLRSFRPSLKIYLFLTSFNVEFFYYLTPHRWLTYCTER